MEDINVDREFKINMNLSGLNAPTGKRAMELPEGYYKGKVSDMYINAEKNAGRVVIKVTVAEGTYSGTIRTTGINVPKSDDDKVRYYWRGLAESCGYGPNDLDAGNIEIGSGTFVNRECFFRFTPKDLTSDGYEKVEFLPGAEWNQQRQMFDANKDGGSSSTNGATLGGGNSVSKNEVLSRLGLGGAA